MRDLLYSEYHLLVLGGLLLVVGMTFLMAFIVYGLVTAVKAMLR